MAYTPFKRAPRCAHLGCRQPGTDHLYSQRLGIDDLFCPDHTRHVIALYPGQVRYTPPAALRVEVRRMWGRSRHRRTV